MNPGNGERRPGGGGVQGAELTTTVTVTGDWRGNSWFELAAHQPPAVWFVLRRHGARLDRTGRTWVAVPALYGCDLPRDLENAGCKVELIDAVPREPGDLPDDNLIGHPIVGDHSTAIEDYYGRLRAYRPPLDPDHIETLVDMRGEDCDPPWGSGICTADPCPMDAHGTGRCGEYAAAFPHRFKAGASMRHQDELFTSAAGSL